MFLQTIAITENDNVVTTAFQSRCLTIYSNCYCNAYCHYEQPSSVYRDQPISVHTVRSIPTVRIYIYIDLYLEILMFLLIFDFMAPLNFYPYSKFRLRFYGKFHTIYKVLKIFFILQFRRIKIRKMAENDVKFCFKNRFFLPFLILICIERKIFQKNFKDPISRVKFSVESKSELRIIVKNKEKPRNRA